MIERLSYLKSRFILAGVLGASLICVQPVRSQSDDPYVVLNTTQGRIRIRVFESRVPQTSGNFLDLVSRGFYNGNAFHRIETWCVQTGDPTGTGQGCFVDPETGQCRRIRLEICPQYHHDRPGMVAMARSQDPDSASAQFYITKSAMPQLNGQYAIFGGVVEGVDVVMRLTRNDRIVNASIDGSGSRVNRSAQTYDTSATPSTGNSQQRSVKNSGY
jgi:peptidyl-prolyl cis-trans isomerase B (cyclophilin B)